MSGVRAGHASGQGFSHGCSHGLSMDFAGFCHKKLGTLWWTNIAIENCHLQWIFPLKMVIFHCYVSSPEGSSNGSCTFSLEPIHWGWLSHSNAAREGPFFRMCTEFHITWLRHLPIDQSLQLGCHGRAASCSADQLLSHCKGKHVFHLFLLDTKSASTGMTSWFYTLSKTSTKLRGIPIIW